MARKGILGTKLGMTQVFDENNKVVPVTVVKAGPNVVTRIRTQERDGYSAVQLAYGEISPRKVNKPVTGQYGAAGVNPQTDGSGVATLGGACSWTVDHAGWGVTLHAPGEQDCSGKTVKDALASCLVWRLVSTRGSGVRRRRPGLWPDVAPAVPRRHPQTSSSRLAPAG